MGVIVPSNGTNLAVAEEVAWAGEGKVGYTGEKLSGDVTLRVMEREQAAQLRSTRLIGHRYCGSPLHS